MGDSDQISLENLAEILQKFGLEIITQFGKTTYNIKILTDKVDEFYTTMIDIKGFMPLLNRIIESQNVLQSEIDLLKSLIQRSNISISQEELEKISKESEKSIDENKKLIKNKFSDLIKNIEKMKDFKLLKIELEAIKRNIFESLGGHKISYEISKLITKMDNVESFSDEIKNEIKDQINFWINKL